MVRDSKTGEMHGLCIDLGKELAKRLDVAFEQVSYEPSQKPPGSVIQPPLLTLIALATNFSQNNSQQSLLQLSGN